MQSRSAVVIGAGPAGLTAAHELSGAGVPVQVFEEAQRVGGIARTETFKGFRFDIGGHRFYTKVSEVEALWKQVLGDDFITVRRLSRIYYDGRFFNYPLSVGNVLANLGVAESVRVVGSYLKARLWPIRPEENFEQWVTNRFGARLFQTFFKSYTEKVWGIPCTQIRADWAAQRIKDLSVTAVVLNALLGVRRPKSLIEEFQYPRLGPGQMWERFAQRIEEQGGSVHLNARVLKLRHDGRRIQSVIVLQKDRPVEVNTTDVIGSMPVGRLIQRLDPAPPQHVIEAAQALRYRDFLIVALVIDQASIFPDNWLYIHSPEIKVGRIQNFKNWSPDMVPDPTRTCLGMEYFCSRGDGFWELPDEKLIAQATCDLEALGLGRREQVEDGCVIRQGKAYPVYDETYMEHLATIRAYLQQFENLQTIGRNGMHRYNNQDHSMLTGLLAARNIMGEQHDLWAVNTERSYYEEQQLPSQRREQVGAWSWRRGQPAAGIQGGQG